MGLPRAAASFPYRCMSCLQAKPAIEMALYDQDRVSGTNTDEAKQDEDLLTLGGEGRHGAADCLLELHLPGACCSHPLEIEIERPWRLRDWRMIETRADEKV